MNAAQSRALVALWDRIAEMREQPADELHLGDGRRVVSIEVRDDDEIGRVVGEDGWQGVTIWTGGRGCCLLLDNDGTVYGDLDSEAPVPAVLTLADDGRISWGEATNG